MNQELQDYIKKAHEAGMTDEQIKQELSKAGWQQADINAELPKSAKKSKKIFLIIGIIVFIIIIGVLGYVFLIKPAQESKTADNLLNESNSIADWKTYRNEELGFEIKYPKSIDGIEYKIIEKEDIEYGESIKHIIFQVPTNSKIYNGSTERFIVSIYPISAWEKRLLEGETPTELIRNDNFVFTEIGWQDVPEDLMNVDFKISQILSTFKFIEAEKTIDAETKDCGLIKDADTILKLSDPHTNATYNDALKCMQEALLNNCQSAKLGMASKTNEGTANVMYEIKKQEGENCLLLIDVVGLKNSSLCEIASNKLLEIKAEAAKNPHNDANLLEYILYLFGNDDPRVVCK